jgi:hypothetical protein
MAAAAPARALHRPAPLQADPYHAWLQASGYAYWGPSVWLPVLLQLRGNAGARSTAAGFAQWVLREQAKPGAAASWTRWLRVSPRYAAPSSRLKAPTTFVPVLVHRQLLAQIDAGQPPAPLIAGYQIGQPLALLGDPLPPCAVQPAPVLQPMSANPAVVLTGVIDDGIPFAHDRLLDNCGQTRIEYLWDQGSPSNQFCHWDYGRELDKRHPVNGFDAVMARCTHSGLVDEDQAYRETGLIDSASATPQALARRASHGAHVLDLACRGRTAPAPDTRPILAVQLPAATVADTSGATLGPQLFNALCWMIERADDVAVRLGQPVLPLVVNASYGLYAGPHNGSSRLELAIDELVAACGGSLQVVLPAGNGRHARCHAQLGLQPGGMDTLRWRVLPDDRTESILEVVLPAGCPMLGFDIVAPDGTVFGPVPPAAPLPLVLNGQLVGQALRVPGGGGNGSLDMLRVTLAPSADARDWLPPGSNALPAAPAGLWLLRLHNPLPNTPIPGIHAWVQRDDTAPGQPRRGRQSHFDEPGYIRFDAGGRLIDADPPLPANGATTVRRDGTLNAIATGRRTVVVGGYVRKGGRPALYSAAGPTLPPRRGPPNPDGPEALLPSDDSPACRGVLAAGNRSGACVAMSGSSVAAPQAARLLAIAIGNGLKANRKALFDAAQAQDPYPPPKPAPRRGGGRMPIRHNRPHPRP